LGLTIGVLKELYPGERRVALTPRALAALAKSGARILIERGAGLEAGFADWEYEEKGASLAASPDEVRDAAAMLLAVRVTPDLAARRGVTHIGFCDPLGEPEVAEAFARAGATLFAMELIPRITRAQSMDALSSMASIAGYKAVLLAAAALPRIFPMMMTAAGALPPARVLVLGAGVAGLQAIATARRLGAVVSAYDVRPAVKQEIESLGAKFVSLALDTSSAEGEGGYARSLDGDFYRRQRDEMAGLLKDFDVVVTTAAVPGRKAPVLITHEMLRGMALGSVIVDLAAGRGGNCEATRAGETVVEHGVTILGPENLPATVPHDASLMYGRNAGEFARHLIRDGALRVDLEDQITRETLVVHDGEIVHPKVRELLEARLEAGANR
jgi:NAD(P) transhydrogenase subunit alpha